MAMTSIAKGQMYWQSEKRWDCCLNAPSPCPCPSTTMWPMDLESTASLRYLIDTALWSEVKDKLKQSANSLSIGQQQRLCLARGLAVEPEIILGDEPTSALDPRSTQKIEELLLSLKEKYTIVLVTHILRQARRVSDFVVFMNEGQIIEMGPTDLVLTTPKDPLTQEYVRGYIS